MRLDLLRASLAIGVLAAACSKKPAEPAATPVSAHASVAATASEGEETAASARVHGLRKLLNVDVPVFVDGKQVAVLRYGELPPGVEPITIPSNAHHAVRYFRVSDYLKGIGVDVDRVKAVHFADKSDRVASLEGAELRGDVDRFVFDFTATTGGMPEMVWSTAGLKTMLRIDYFYALNVFVTKKPWTIDRAHHCYLEDDGECRPVARFTDGDLAKGTRVYLDGKLVSYVKRRLISDSAIAEKTSDDEAVFSTERYLASLGIRTADAKRIELLSGDSVIASASADEWAADVDALTFRVVRHAHGKVRANVPADLQARTPGATDREAQVTAIEVFSRKEPRSTAVVPLDEVVDLDALPRSAVARADDPQD